MADYFTFTAGDPYLKQKLDPGDLTGVTRWQMLTFDYSFHMQHELGWPLYVIEPGKRGVRNRPKINLKDKTSAQAKYEEGKFDDNRIGVEAKDVAVANWAIFQKLAERYYVGTTTTAAPTAARKALVFKCNSPQCRGRTVTQEYQGADKPPATVTHMAKQGLGSCKQCKQKNWEYVETRALGPAEKPNVPLTQTTPMAQI